MSDFCAIDATSVGSNEGVFSPRNFLNASSWSGSNQDLEGTTYSFYGYYPQLTAPASTYTTLEGKGGVLLEVPAAQTGEFGRYQICSSSQVTMTKGDILKNKMVRFAFTPVTSLIRLRLTLSAATDKDIKEAYIKQVILEAKNSTANLTGGCFLTFADGKLASTETAVNYKQIVVTLPSPVKITADKESNPYIDFVLLAAKGVNNITFDARLQDNTKVSVAPQDAPAEGFAAGVRYTLDRSITLTIDEDSDDSAYVDGGSAWDSNIDHDGFYTDAGYAW